MTDSAGRRPLWLAPMPVKGDGTSPIRRLLIANRGEIACRIIATCRELQIATIAIYVDEDATSRHIKDADEAVNLGSVSQEEGNPFLNIQLLVETALSVDANAVHPGYGYLSENVQFADAVRAAGITYVGPGSEAISTLGDKRQAKEYLAAHEPSVPLIPGYTGSSTGIQISDLHEQSEKIGFPVMIKASAGGGGKGMRIVHDKSALAEEFERAQSEAKRSFGLADCILEKYIEAGKHVEVQIMGDQHGNVITLWERECSVQRRHQKVIEESPCSWLSQTQRENMCAAARKIGELLKYEGAGTVEFIVDIKTGSFYFLEVNARLQVEHPITEECTGLDVVSLQLCVASGGRLADLPNLKQIPQNGHAIECRLCAEDPNRDFAPQHGLIQLWNPWEQPDTRFETAIVTGGRVSIYFDSMIAKVVVWAPNRTLAIEKMAKVLANTACVGVSTNQLFLQSCLLNERFRDIKYSTSFIPENLSSLLNDPYAKAASRIQNLLHLTPSLFLRYLEEEKRLAGGHLFGSIRKGFRNQTFDRVNLPSDIVTTNDLVQGAEVDPRVIQWPGSILKNSGVIEVRSAPLTEVTTESKDKSSEADPSAVVTQSYNTLSASIRAGSLPGANKFQIKIQDLRSTEHVASPTSSWKIGKVDISVGHRRILGYVCTSDENTSLGRLDMGDSSRIFVHFPALGTHYGYRTYSILSYFEGKRLAEAGATGADSGSIKAHMPCKVLKVLKKAGDQVKTGEVLLVVESMKMEITVAAPKDGQVESVVLEGDAADEGSILCKLS